MTSALHLLLLSFTLLLVRPTTGHDIPAALQQAYENYLSICNNDAGTSLGTSLDKFETLEKQLNGLNVGKNAWDLAMLNDMNFLITKSIETLTESKKHYEETMKEYNEAMEEFKKSKDKLLEQSEAEDECQDKLLEQLEQYKDKKKLIINEAKKYIEELITGYKNVWTMYTLIMEGKYKEAEDELTRRGRKLEFTYEEKTAGLLFSCIKSVESQGLLTTEEDELFSEIGEGGSGRTFVTDPDKLFVVANSILKRAKSDDILSTKLDYTAGFNDDYTAVFREAFRLAHADLYAGFYFRIAFNDYHVQDIALGVALGEVLDELKKKSTAAGRSSARSGYLGKAKKRQMKKRQMRKRRQRGRM